METASRADLPYGDPLAETDEAMTQVLEKPENMLAETEITLEMIEAGLRALT